MNTQSCLFGLPNLLCLCLSACVCGSEVEDTGDSSPNDKANLKITRELLVDKRFEFSWKSSEGGAVNGIATLCEDGSIKGIASPNETTWVLDADGALLFKHADGRVSTRFDTARRIEGLLCFKGPFLFRNGITHYLVEVADQAPARKYVITPAQAAQIRYSTQRFVYLDIGESFLFECSDGTKKGITLLSVKEERDSVIKLVRRADVAVTINGKRCDLVCAPYTMPREIDGIRIQADTTSKWLNIPKRVQFSLWDAADEIVDTESFSFPLPQYRLFSHGMQGYNEPVHLGHRDGDPGGQCFYHNYGVDLAGYEGRQKVVSCIDGVVSRIDRGEGDLFIRDDSGFELCFCHLDAVLSGLEEGTAVRRGQWVGMLGKRGGSGNFSHLHVGVRLQTPEWFTRSGGMSRTLNLFPWLVAAYRKEHGTDPLAVARPFKTVRTGERVQFDGSSCIAGSSRITAFKWKFHDGTSVNGPRATKAYKEPGCYSASLWIEDASGKRDVDFYTVRVYAKSDPEHVVPTLFVTYTPAEEVRVGDPVNFRIWPQGRGVASISVDFGDGTVLRDYTPYSAITHAFTSPGIHVVTVSGKAGTLPVAQKTKVYVLPE